MQHVAMTLNVNLCRLFISESVIIKIQYTQPYRMRHQYDTQGAAKNTLVRNKNTPDDPIQIVVASSFFASEGFFVWHLANLACLTATQHFVYAFVN